MKARQNLNQILKVLILTPVLLISCLEETIDPAEFGSISGTVFESSGKDGLSGVEIKTTPASYVTFTDSLGNFSFSQLPVGEYTFTASLIGYERTFVSAGISLNLNTEVTILMNRIIARPGLAFNPVPESGALDVERNIQISWSSGNEENDTLSYKVFVYESNLDTPFFQSIGISDTFISLENLRYNCTYFWQVNTISSTEDEVKGELWNFRTIDFPDNRFLFIRPQKGVFQVFSASGDTSEAAIQITEYPFNSLKPLFGQHRQEIAYISDASGDRQIHIMDNRGQNSRQITSLPIDGYHSNGSEYCWWPDHGGFVYSHYDRLYRIDRNGANLRIILQANPGRHFGDCDYSGAAGKIVVQTLGSVPYEGEIILMDEDGTDSVVIVNDLPGVIENPSFSIDGKKVMFTHDISGFQSLTGRQLDARIFIMDLDSMHATDVSLNKPAGTNDINPQFSPFGSKIIFTNVYNDNSGQASVYTMDLDGTNRQLLFENADMPHWK